MQKIQHENLKIDLGKSINGITVDWFRSFNNIPDDIPLIVIGQEFLDAFPVHQFVFTDKGWREKLVDVDTSMDSPYHFKIVLSSNSTPASKVLLKYVKFTPSIGDGIEISPLALATGSFIFSQ
jgi:NADH dehydrogenase [ubiquinone] 1 alpha subcomplex assembly factor 7